MSIELNFLVGCNVVNRSGAAGEVISVEEKLPGNIYISCRFSDGKVSKFPFMNNGRYFTEFLTIQEQEAAVKAEQVVSAHKKVLADAEEEAARAKAEKEAQMKAAAEEEQRNTLKFSRRNKKYAEFSNFYECNINYDGRIYKNSEAAWQSLKSMDPEVRDKFTGYSASGSKSMGRRVQLRKDWESVKVDLMYEVCLAKFTQNPELGELLLSTGDKTIVEDTTGWHDNTWGDCSCERCKYIQGKNYLGKTLMKVRDTLRG